jgi:hypothetical protein
MAGEQKDHGYRPDIGEDGWPVDPNHPANKNNDTGVWLEKRCNEMLASREKVWRSGSKTNHSSERCAAMLAVVDAIAICRLYRQPPPEWLEEAVASIVDDRLSKDQKRRRREAMIHYTRSDAVSELYERRKELLVNFNDDRGRTLERCYEAVSERFEDTEAGGSVETIRKSCQIVAKETKEGRGGQYMIFGPRLDSSSDSFAFTTKRG